ncbi:myocardin-related transcription factor B isoform X2 [Brachyhypopomus gauderio]|uniref:myocardin-related transcription factor B isoform X2 n=1 Tax=Brachyhypopomus gauderio TaxID=698409 RepID=UPI0040429615
MEPQGSLVAEGDQGVLVPSPRSEAVTHDMEELSLQPNQNLPPIKDRKSVLQLRLQQRRTREQLVEQGIMPPLKTPAVFHEQIRSLERARTENFLKHKIRSRPDRAELVRMHILQETQAEPSLQAAQMKLKRARLADDLNEKIAQRPGPLELVQKNILPVDSNHKEAILKEAIIEEEVSSQKTLDVYNFDEDSSEALSPENTDSQESQSSVPSPIEAKLPEISASPSSGSNAQLCPPTSQSSEPLSQTSDQVHCRTSAASRSAASAGAPRPGPALVKQSQPKLSSEKSRGKKSKEPKPRVRKLKYHQYVPPDQKQEPSEARMDSAYARLLHQQQHFLHLQILSQQQNNYQAILPAPRRPMTEAPSGLHPPVVVSLPCSTPARPNHAPTASSRRPGPLPANLDEMKVAELKMELKLRGLPVSGTKTDLIERLRPFQDSSAHPATSMETSGGQQPQHVSTSPPASPVTSQGSGTPMEETPSGTLSLKTEEAVEAKMSEKDHCLHEKDHCLHEKDQRLHEKERQIKELMRKLEQEQRLVEQLKMQLEVEKRSQQGAPQQADPAPPAPIKEEREASPSCTSTRDPLGALQTELKQEEPQVQQFYVGPPHQTGLVPQPGHVLGVPAVQGPCTSTPQTAASGPSQDDDQTSFLLKAESAALEQHTRPAPATPAVMGLCVSPSSAYQLAPNQSLSRADVGPCYLSSSPESHPARLSPRHTAPNGLVTKCPSPCPPTYILPMSPFTNHHSPKSKDPPRYEEAVKQRRALHATMQVPTVTSQHMDDLFDVLVESGEISPLIQQDPLCLDTLLPVTASVTTLPINTALSRPPAHVQVARVPCPTPEPPPSLVALATEDQLEALLEGSLVAEAEPRALCLMDEVHSQLLEPAHSSMDTSEIGFSHSPQHLHLHDAGLEHMEWMDLTGPGPAGISAIAGVFSSDFLDSRDLHWE